VGSHQVEYTTPRIELAPRVVCAPCNNGWMSDLQSQAKPLLLPFIAGRSGTLSIRQQHMIAAWTIMTFIVLEYIGGSFRNKYFTDDERQIFRRSVIRGAPNIPGGTFIWLGHYVGKHVGRTEDHDLTLTLHDGTNRPMRAYLALHTVLRLTIQLYAHRLAVPRGVARILRTDQVTFRVSRAVDVAFVAIWPAIAKRAWPPEEALDDESLNQIVAEWKGGAS
jgi:hypothetical protein